MGALAEVAGDKHKGGHVEEIDGVHEPVNDRDALQAKEKMGEHDEQYQYALDVIPIGGSSLWILVTPLWRIHFESILPKIR